MGKLQNFSIEFESPYGVCQAGQAVIGAVCVQVSDATNTTGELNTFNSFCICRLLDSSFQSIKTFPLGNGAASFPVKTGTVQLMALLSFIIMVTCSRGASSALA